MSDALEDLKSKAGTGRCRVLFRHVRRHAGQAVRETRAGRGSRTSCYRGAPGLPVLRPGDIGQSPADPDLIAVPDPASYTLAPWQPGLAVLQCDVHVEGVPWPYSPRLILQQVLEMAKTRGFTYQVGCEAEYFLATAFSGRPTGYRRPGRLPRNSRATTPRRSRGCTTTSPRSPST